MRVKHTVKHCGINTYSEGVSNLCVPLLSPDPQPQGQPWPHWGTALSSTPFCSSTATMVPSIQKALPSLLSKRQLHPSKIQLSLDLDSSKESLRHFIRPLPDTYLSVLTHSPSPQGRTCSPGHLSVPVTKHKVQHSNTIITFINGLSARHHAQCFIYRSDN